VPRTPSLETHLTQRRRGEKYVVKINHKGVHYYFGPFDTPLEAAKARDKNGKELFGKFAWLNFPDEDDPKPDHDGQ
jgi:hypothetical protein